MTLAQIEPVYIIRPPNKRLAPKARKGQLINRRSGPTFCEFTGELGTEAGRPRAQACVEELELDWATVDACALGPLGQRLH